MSNVTRETELAVRMPPEPGEIARLIATVGAAHIETLASCTYQDRDSAVMLLVTDDALWAGAVLRDQSFRVTANEVVLVHAAYEPRLAVPLGRRLTEANIGVLYSYASWTEAGQAYVVFKTTDDERAASLLRTEMLLRDVAREKTLAPERGNWGHIAA